MEFKLAYLGQRAVHTVTREGDKVSNGCYTSFALRQWMWCSLTLGEWAFYNV